MGTNLTFQYDREADILYINTCPPYPEQESEELDDEIIARFNPETGEIENLEVMFFSTRLLRKELFQLPISARLHLYENIKSAEGQTV
jgi:uncharacterized protein YuzE